MSGIPSSEVLPPDSNTSDEGFPVCEIINLIYKPITLFLHRHFEDFELRIPRAEMVQLRDFAVGAIKKIDAEYVAKVCGSFRRGGYSL